MVRERDIFLKSGLDINMGGQNLVFPCLRIDNLQRNAVQISSQIYRHPWHLNLLPIY